MGLYGMIYEFTTLVAACYVAVSIVAPQLELPLVAFAMGWTLGGIVINSKIIKEIEE